MAGDARSGWMHCAESSASILCPCIGPHMLSRTAAEMMARSVINRYRLRVSSSDIFRALLSAGNVLVN
jgi:hypothetical protein